MFFVSPSGSENPFLRHHRIYVSFYTSRIYLSSTVVRISCICICMSYSSIRLFGNNSATSLTAPQLVMRRIKQASVMAEILSVPHVLS